MHSDSDPITHEIRFEIFFSTLNWILNHSSECITSTLSKSIIFKYYTWLYKKIRICTFWNIEKVHNLAEFVSKCSLIEAAYGNEKNTIIFIAKKRYKCDHCSMGNINSVSCIFHRKYLKVLIDNGIIPVTIYQDKNKGRCIGGICVAYGWSSNIINPYFFILYGWMRCHTRKSAIFLKFPHSPMLVPFPPDLGETPPQVWQHWYTHQKAFWWRLTAVTARAVTSW